MTINFSQLWALYVLVWLYHLLQEELEPFHPMAKFLSVKLVVFFTFWQGIALALAVKYSLITDNRSDNMSTGQVQVAINSTLICIEMFIASLAHKCTFPEQGLRNRLSPFYCSLFLSLYSLMQTRSRGRCMPTAHCKS